jgi:hypothetical protein
MVVVLEVIPNAFLTVTFLVTVSSEEKITQEKIISIPKKKISPQKEIVISGSTKETSNKTVPSCKETEVIIFTKTFHFTKTTLSS